MRTTMKRYRILLASGSKKYINASNWQDAWEAGRTWAIRSSSQVVSVREAKKATKKEAARE